MSLYRSNARNGCTPKFDGLASKLFAIRREEIISLLTLAKLTAQCLPAPALSRSDPLTTSLRFWSG
jgi:hypothetical protein